MLVQLQNPPVREKDSPSGLADAHEFASIGLITIPQGSFKTDHEIELFGWQWNLPGPGSHTPEIHVREVDRSIFAGQMGSKGRTTTAEISDGLWRKLKGIESLIELLLLLEEFFQFALSHTRLPAFGRSYHGYIESRP